MSQDYLPEPGVRIVRHDAGCEAYLPSGSCDCGNARYVDEEGREISMGKRDAGDLLVQAEHAAEWLVLCPRDNVSLTLESDGTERCPECGWRTGDDLLAPAAQRGIERHHRQRRGLVMAFVFIVMNVALIAMFRATDLVRHRVSAWAYLLVLPVGAWAYVRVTHPFEEPGEDDPWVGSLYKTGGGVNGQGQAPTRPPLPASRPPKSSVCSVCHGPIDLATNGWCATCGTYASQRDYDRQIIASFSVPADRIGPSPEPVTRRMRPMP